MEDATKPHVKEYIGSYECETNPSPTPRRRRSSDANATLRTIHKQDEESMLHDSSEFMLVLYPGEEDDEINRTNLVEKGSESIQQDSQSLRRPSSKMVLLLILSA
jgi:hypothetical protein